MEISNYRKWVNISIRKKETKYCHLKTKNDTSDKKLMSLVLFVLKSYLELCNWPTNRQCSMDRAVFRSEYLVWFANRIDISYTPRPIDSDRWRRIWLEIQKPLRMNSDPMRLFWSIVFERVYWDLTIARIKKNDNNIHYIFESRSRR